MLILILERIRLSICLRANPGGTVHIQTSIINDELATTHDMPPFFPCSYEYHVGKDAMYIPLAKTMKCLDCNNNEIIQNVIKLLMMLM